MRVIRLPMALALIAGVLIGGAVVARSWMAQDAAVVEPGGAQLPLTLVREFRFRHQGAMWGSGIIGDHDRDVLHDTGLAMVRSWQWA